MKTSKEQVALPIPFLLRSTAPPIRLLDQPSQHFQINTIISSPPHSQLPGHRLLPLKVFWHPLLLTRDQLPDQPCTEKYLSTRVHFYSNVCLCLSVRLHLMVNKETNMFEGVWWYLRLYRKEAVINFKEEIDTEKKMAEKGESRWL